MTTQPLLHRNPYTWRDIQYTLDHRRALDISAVIHRRRVNRSLIDDHDLNGKLARILKEALDLQPNNLHMIRIKTDNALAHFTTEISDDRRTWHILFTIDYPHFTDNGIVSVEIPPLLTNTTPRAIRVGSPEPAPVYAYAA